MLVKKSVLGLALYLFVFNFVLIGLHNSASSQMPPKGGTVTQPTAAPTPTPTPGCTINTTFCNIACAVGLYCCAVICPTYNICGCYSNSSECECVDCNDPNCDCANAFATCNCGTGTGGPCCQTCGWDPPSQLSPPNVGGGKAGDPCNNDADCESPLVCRNNICSQ